MRINTGCGSDADSFVVVTIANIPGGTLCPALGQALCVHHLINSLFCAVKEVVALPP